MTYARILTPPRAASALLCLALLSGIWVTHAQEKKRLSIYSSHGNFSVSVSDHDGKEYASLPDVLQSALAKHSEIRAMFQRELGLGYGNADVLAQVLRDTANDRSAAAPAAPDDMANALYTGAKAALRPIHDRLMAGIEQLGAYKIAPKKGYLSLRRSKQFAMIGPATNTRVEVGLNMKGVAATARLAEMPGGSMCNYKINALMSRKWMPS